MTRTLQLVVFICCLTGWPCCGCGETPSALDGMDRRALELALRAIKMTAQDLSFQKTNAESELVLQKTRWFLEKPLLLPAYGDFVLGHCANVSSMQGLATFGWQQLEISESPLDFKFPPVNIDAEFLARLPLSLARAVRNIVDASAFARALLAHSLPAEKNLPFAAFAVQTFQLDQDKAEVDRWQEAGMDATKLRELLRRSENLELQDTELADAILSASDKFSPAELMLAAEGLAGAVDAAIAELHTNQFTEDFQFETDTPLGKIIVGGAGPNVYTNEAFLIIDTGGDDTYLNSAGGANGLVGRPISIVIDLGGSDQFISKRSCSQGAGVFGIGILAALGSNCTFQAKHLSQGAGFFGGGLLMAGPGRQTFEADTFCQGAGTFGAGVLWQRGGDTTYKATELAQGFGGTSGLGLLLDEGGDDSYFAGGKHPCGWLPNHYFSLSQGFGEGMRPFAGGGVGVLCDLAGDDHYAADVYGQGASYWYSVGLLLDRAGNDKYDAYQYCQGAGIHLSAGELIDWAGDDTYTAGHICQGAAHDYSIGIQIDRAGNDKYTGDTTAQGSAINNSFALLLDRSGNDHYIGTDPKQSQAAGHDGDKREYGSIALLLDLGGDDEYSQGQTNDAIWLKPFYGAGLDCETQFEVAATWPLEVNFASATVASRVSTQRLYSIAPVNPHQPIEQLVRRAVSDHPDAGTAMAELKKRGTEGLSYLITRLDSPDVLIRVKAEELVDALDTNAIPVLIKGIDEAKNDEIARLACYYLARFNEKAKAAIPSVLPLIDRDKTQTVAFYTLGHLHARQAFSPALKALDSPKELVRLRAAQALGRIGDARAIPKLIRALGDEMYDVRYAAEGALVALGKPSIGPLRRAHAKLPPRAKPHVLEALAKLGDRRALTWMKSALGNDDPLVRTAVEKQLTEQYHAAVQKR